ncbi:lysophospholipase L1-like esterase [Methylobacterium sp. RAS18]|nr:lysophospholipase L1-like esterase [Methylobacterium sp. RAS18]
MSVTDWSPQPSGNAMADRAIPARDGMAGREFSAAIRGLMAKAAALALDQGGTLATTGTGNVYEVTTFSRVTELKAGVRIAARIDRANTSGVTLNVDGHGPYPWLDSNGSALAPGALQSGRLTAAAWSDSLQAWISDVIGVGNVVGLDGALGGKANTADLAGRLSKSANLSDLESPTAGRASLGLKAGATLDLAAPSDAAAGIGNGLMDAGRTAAAIASQVSVPPTLAADATGQADALIPFRDAPRTTPYQVKPGGYSLSSPVNDENLILEFPRPGVSFSGAEVYCEIYKSFLYRPGLPQLAHVIEKMRSGQPVTIVVRGDSLVWGLIGDGLGNSAVEGNGYTGVRSSITIPQALQAMLRSIYQYNSAGGLNITVVNQGYPGDRTFELINRWKSYDAANKPDLVLMMIGTNDALAPKNIAISPAFIKNFVRYHRQNIERLRENGTAVILMASPPSPTLTGNAQLHLYREAVTRLAREYNLPLVDAAEQLRQLGTSPWVAADDVHLTTPGYNLLGRSVAALLTPMGGLLSRPVGPGAQIVAADMPCDGFGGFIGRSPYAASRSGFVIQVDPTYTLSIPIYVERDCVPVFETITPDSGQLRHMTLLIDGATAVVGQFSAPVFDGTFRRAFAGPVLRRGYHVLQFRASGGAAAFLDAVKFVDPATATIGTGGVFRRSPLAGWERPRAFLTGICAERETRFVRWAQWISARIEWGPQQAGIGLVADEIPNLGYLSNNALLLLRDATNLVIRDLMTGAPDVIATGVLPAGVTRSKIDIEFTSPTAGQGQMNVYLDGAQVATLSRAAPPMVGGYVIVASLQPGIMHLPSLGVCEG